MTRPGAPNMRSGAPEIRADGVPATLRWAIWLLGAQAIGLLGVVGLLIFADLTAGANNARDALLVTAYAAVMAIILGGLSWALSRRQRWARSPAIVLELLLLPIGYTMAASGLPLLGIPILLVGLAGAALLLAPATRAALGVR